MEVITSRANEKIKRARALRQRKARQERGAFLVEGIRHVGEALEAGAEIEEIFFAPELLRSPLAQGWIEKLAERGLPCHAASAAAFASLAEKENPQGILAVVRQRLASLEDLHPGNFPWGVALVNPQDPGNLGAILRTIDAVGASGLLLLEESADPFHPSAVRASMGAIFWHPLARASFEESAAWAHRNAYHVYGASAHASRDFREVAAYERPAILLLGSEREGLTPEQAALCQDVLRLPMRGRTTSLNLAVAAGVLLYAMLPR